MKRTLAVVVVAAALTGALAWLTRGTWWGSSEEGEPATDVPVQVAKIARRTVRRWVTVYGTVEPEPAGASRPGAGTRLAAPVTGVVAEVACVEGQRVEKGALLFRLESPVADVAVEFARLALERERKLLATGGTSRKALQEAERQLATARADQALLRVEAPFAGVVTRVDARPGQAVDPTTILGELMDPDRVVVTAGAPAAELGALRAGQPVEVSSAGAAPVHGTVLYVSPRVDATTGLGLLRIGIPAGAGLRAGQFVKLRIVSEERPDRLTVPAESVVTLPDGQSVVSVVEGDEARQVPIERGLRDGDVVEVAGAGLQDGTTVVTAGAYGLPERTRIRVLGGE
jgi:membrane fusion protein, multidrug efflux system